MRRCGARFWAGWSGGGAGAAESLEPGAVVTDVARRHGCWPQQVHDWRRRARFGPVGIAGVGGHAVVRAGGVLVDRDCDCLDVLIAVALARSPLAKFSERSKPRRIVGRLVVAPFQRLAHGSLPSASHTRTNHEPDDKPPGICCLTIPNLLPRNPGYSFGLVGMTSVFSTLALPHWLLIAGTFLLLLGLLGLALRRRSVEAKADAAASERELFKPPAYESPEEFYNLVTEEKPKDRLAEKVDDPAELLLRWAGQN
jgi:Transposase